MKDIEIIVLTKEKIVDVLKEDLFWNDNSEFMPFSKSKANWLLKSDRIEKDDVCGVIAHENKEIVSFIYLVPDYIKTENNIEKVYWSRRWWIANKYKDSILPTYIMNTAVNAVKNKVLIKFLGKAVEEYYKKQPFVEFSHRTRYFIIFSFDTNMLVNRAKALKHLKGILNKVDNLSHYIVSVFNNKKAKKQTKNLVYDYISNIDEKLWQFIAPFCENDLIPKTRDYINWQIDNNQYTNALVNHKYTKKCLVSSVYNRIYNTSYSIKKEGKIIGFTSFLVRGKEAMVRYFICEDVHFEACASALIENVAQTKVTTFQTENEKLGKFISKKFMNLHTNKRKLYALAHNDIKIDFDTITIKDREGNFA